MEKILIAIVLAIGIIWRLPVFSPPGLNWDEVSLGYNAYSMLLSGADEWGIKMPSIFRAFGDYKLPTYIYMTTLWPLNPRVTSILAGSLTILVSYLLACKLFGKRAGFVTLVLVAFSPWMVMLSRLALEANLAVLFVSLGILCLVCQKHFLSILFLGISVWTYNSARIFVPMFLFLYVFLSKEYKKYNLGHYLFILVIFIPMFVQLFNAVGQARFSKLSLIDGGAIAKINELQTTRWGGRLIYNKVTYFISEFAKNYISYLSPNFLFIKGGDHYQFNVQNYGLLYLICLPFFYLGIIKNINNKLLMLWLLLAPLAGSATRDSPHTLRAIVMLPLPMILTSLGVVTLVKKYYLLFCLFIVFFAANYLFITNSYYRSYSREWQFGSKEVVQLIKDNYPKYDQIVFSKKYGEPHEFVAFYWPWDPDFYRPEWEYHDSWFWINRLDKIIFVNDWEMKSYPYKRKTLIISSGENIPPGTQIKRINFLDGKPAFIILEL